MLIMFFIYVLKKNFKNHHSWKMIEVFKKRVYKIKYAFPFLLLAITSSENVIFEVEKISFSVIRNESSIGFIDIEKTIIDKTTTYIINSEVNAKVILNFNAIGKEKSIYNEDTLIYSSVYRKLNDKVKLNQSLSLNNGKYILKIKDRKETLHFDVINRNFVTLYFFEPKGISQVYSDKYKEMVKITPISEGNYKVILPDNSTNIYHYKNGKCNLIEVEGTFYKIKLIAKNKTNTIENL